MASPATSYRITAVVEGLEKIEALKQTIRLLANSTTPAAEAVSELRQKALELGNASNASTKDIRTAVDALKGLKDAVSLTSSEYKVLTGDIQSIGSRLDSATGSVTRHTQAQVKLGQVVNANSRAVNNYFSNAAVRQQEQLNQRIQQQMRTPTLALPAAGQSSFKGAVDASGFGGGARRGTGTKESPFEIGSDPSSRQRYMGATRSDSEVAAAAGYLERDASAAKTAAAAANQYQSELEQLFNSVRKYQGQQVANKNQQVAYSYRELTEEITRVTASSNGSLNSLRQQRQLWEQLYNAVEKTDPAYARARANMQRLDKDISSRTPGNQNRLQRFGQSAGAIAASGVFGGPEGAVGAGIGAAFGPAGALAGGAIGAQVGMGRQRLGEFATYAADIEKLEIALKGVTKTQGEYEAAVRAAASVTRDFNVPQLEATQGITKLSAAVIGAGGKVADAEVVFRNVTAAIKATGGSSEDVQGAITALSQIFSKGKVSAEELQGQLGERLPGAVTMFAKATGRTLPQLQKDLEQGVVGLADLMKFVVGPDGLGQFEQGALRVASSSADAGARLVTTWNQTKQAIGEAIAPLGAQIQDSLGRLLKELTPSLIGLAKGLAAAIKLIVDNFGAIGNIVKFAAELAALNLAIKLFTGYRLGVSAVFLAFETGGAKAALSAISATRSITALRAATALLAKTWAAPVILTVVVAGFEQVIDRINKLRDARREFLESAKEAQGGEWFRSIGGNAQSSSQISKNIQAVGDSINYNTNQLQALKDKRKSLELQAQLADDNTSASGIQQQLSENAIRIAEAEKRIKTGRSRIDYAYAQLAKQKIDPPNKLSELTNFAQPTPTGGAGKDKVDKAAKAADDLAAQQQRLNEENAKAQIELDDRRFQHGQENARRLYEFQLELDRKQRDNWVKMQTGAARTAAGLASSYFAQLEDLQAKRFDAQQKYEAAQQQQRSQAQIAAVTAAGTDIAAPSNSNAVSRLFEAANSKLGLFAGQTERCADAIRELFKVAGIAIGTTKKAWDGLGSGPSLASSFFGSDIGQRINKKEDLRKGDLVGFDRTYGSWGKGVQTHVGMYAGDGMMYDHSSRRGLTKRPLDTFAGKFLYGVRPNALAGGTPGQNAQQRRSVATAGEAQERGLDVAQADAAKKATELENAARQLAIDIGLVADYTDSLRTQNAELKNSAQLTQQRNRLELEGVRPELIDAEDKKLAKTLEVQQANQGLTASLNEAKIRYTENSEEYKKAALIFEEAKAKQSGYLQEFVQLTDQAAAAQIAYNDALAKVNIAREGAKTISDGFKGFLKTAITGGDIQDAAKQMATSIRDKFLDMALDAAFKPFEEMLFKGFKDAMGLNKPADAATQAANTQLDAAGKMNAAADKMLNAASGTAVGDMSSLALPGFPDGVPSYAQALATPTNFAATASSSSFGSLGFDPSAAFGVATDAGTAFATSMSQVNDSLSKAPTAAQEANKGMQNFLGGMAGVAAGAMAIAGGIQQIGKGGTSNVLGGIGSVLLGLGGAFGGLGGMGLFGKRAAGGPVAAQRPYMVGERGPELFMPSTSGSIGATSALRDAMASGGSSGGSPVLNMSFQSTNIGGIEYVSRDQLEQAMAETRRAASRDGAKRGMSMTLDRLQQSPGTRSRVGIR